MLFPIRISPLRIIISLKTNDQKLCQKLHFLTTFSISLILALKMAIFAHLEILCWLLHWELKKELQKLKKE